MIVMSSADTGDQSNLVRQPMPCYRLRINNFPNSSYVEFGLRDFGTIVSVSTEKLRPENPVVEFGISKSNSTVENEGITLDVANVLSSLYVLCQDPATEDDAIDFAYDTFSGILAKRHFSECNRILSLINEKRITPAVIASILTITRGAIHKTECYREFFRRASDYLVALRGPMAAQRILHGLGPS